jgi:small GTP-binding protein
MEDDDNYDLIFKIVLIGDSGVGKTNILSRYINNEFSMATKSTVGVEFGSKIIKQNDKTIKIQIWDTAGQERYKSITTAYYKGAKGAFVVYDITRRETFNNVNKWIGDLKTSGNEDVYILLIGNKSDLENARQVPTEEIEKKAEQLKVAFCETSALDGTNIEHAFELVVDEISKKTLKAYENEIKSEDRIKAITLDTGSKDEKDKNKKGCCN